MSLYTYEVFEIVAELESFTRAADEMNLTRSAVSHAIAGLEKEFGFPLFIRDRSGVTLTAEGQKLLPLVSAVRRCNESLIQEVERINSKETGIVRVGCFHSAGIMWMPEIIRRFKEKYPDIVVEIKRGSYEEIMKQVDENRTDLCLVSKIAVEDQDFTKLYDDPLVYVAHPDFESKHKTFVTVEEIKSNNLIMQREAAISDTREFIEKNEIKVTNYLDIDDDNMLMAMVEKGLGMSIIPKLAYLAGSSDVKMMEIESGVHREIGIAIANPRFMSPATRLFRKEIVEYIEEIK